MDYNRQRGSLLIYTIVVIFIFSVVLVGILSVAMSQMRVLKGSVNRELAFQIAESGVNYYEWHLAHFPTDYQDGTGVAGSYVHDFTDKYTNKVIGQFSLSITPPPIGSTIVTIQSTGWTLENPAQTRVVTVTYGINSLAKFAFLTNGMAWIGPTESVSGLMHSNNGIHFDGTGNAPITSAKATYSCPTSMGCTTPQTQPGIWGNAPQSTKNFWQFPVANIDFSSVTADFAALKNKAQTDGAPAYLSPSNKLGYSLVFTSNGKVDIYLVKKVLNAPAQAWDINGVAVNTSIDYDPASSQRQLLYNQVSFPTNGVFYIEDNVWVEGVIKGRVNIVAAKLPYNSSTAPKIIIPNNLVYAAYDNTNSLGLLSQKDILVAYNAPTNLRIDGALMAQNGSIQVYNYPANTNIKNSITVFGSLASYGSWTWGYVNSSGTIISGYRNTSTNYDSNLLYSPPPSFPLTTGGYQQLSWTSN